MKFTMAEFISEHGLGVSTRDAGATKLIAAKLRTDGFRRVKMKHRGRMQWVWTNEGDTHRVSLKSKLASIKL